MAMGFGRTRLYTNLHTPLKSTVLDAEKYLNTFWHFQFINRSQPAVVVLVDAKSSDFMREKAMLKT